jgi:transposase InsO family protein
LELGPDLSSRLAIEALKQAIESRQPSPGLVHHSDRGIQYACAEYVQILRRHEMISSMSRPANPYDNASCESFIKTLKREEIYANEYVNIDHLRNNIEEFIERYYNQQRLHSALGYCSPEEFEQQTLQATQARSLSPVLAFRQESSPDCSTGLLGKGLAVLQTSCSEGFS